MSKLNLTDNITKIKNGKLKKIKVGAITTAMFFTMNNITGCDILEDAKNEYERQIEEINSTEKVFAPGTHYLVVEIEHLGIKTKQINYHAGYEIVEIALENTNSNSGKALYVNTEEVKCKATSLDENGNPRFDDFGTLVPKELVK